MITPDTVDEMNELIDAVQIRISPWQLLYRRMKEVLLDEMLSDKMLKSKSFVLRRTPEKLKIVSMKTDASLLKRWREQPNYRGLEFVVWICGDCRRCGEKAACRLRRTSHKRSQNLRSVSLL